MRAGTLIGPAKSFWWLTRAVPAGGPTSAFAGSVACAGSSAAPGVRSHGWPAGHPGGVRGAGVVVVVRAARGRVAAERRRWPGLRTDACARPDSPVRAAGGGTTTRLHAVRRVASRDR